MHAFAGWWLLVWRVQSLGGSHPTLWRAFRCLRTSKQQCQVMSSSAFGACYSVHLPRPPSQRATHN